MLNKRLADTLYAIADILEMKQVAWKPQAYRNAARTIESLAEPIEDIVKKSGLKGVIMLPGIGEGIGKKIVEYVRSQTIKEFEALQKDIYNDYHNSTA